MPTKQRDLPSNKQSAAEPHESPASRDAKDPPKMYTKTGVKKKEKKNVRVANKSPSQRMSLNRSQYGGCSSKYDTQTST